MQERLHGKGVGDGGHNNSQTQSCGDSWACLVDKAGRAPKQYEVQIGRRAVDFKTFPTTALPIAAMTMVRQAVRDYNIA